MRNQRYFQIGAIVALATATGLVLSGSDLAQAVFSGAPADEELRVLAIEPVAGPDSQAAPAPSGLMTTLQDFARAEAATDPNAMTKPQVLPAASGGCHKNLALAPREGAMIDMGLIAPCYANQRLTIRHGELVFTGQTSAAGTLFVSLPALHSPAEVTITLENGEVLREAADIPQFTDYERFVAQWAAPEAFTLNGFVNGAAWGEAGHISAETTASASAKGGFLTALGDPQSPAPLFAQVFTWPKGLPSSAPSIEVTLEAEVTTQTCGRSVTAQGMHLSGGKITEQAITLAMPDCGAIGEFVVLSNPFGPTRLASN